MHRDGPSPEEEYFHREDQERLRKLKEAADAEKAEADKKALRELHLNHCGKCGTRMDTRLFRGVEIEVDGLARELSAILDYADQLGAVPGLDLGRASEGSDAPLRPRADEVETPLGHALVELAAEHTGDEVRVPNVVGEVT